jgi:hypothetical protein
MSRAPLANHLKNTHVFSNFICEKVSYKFIYSVLLLKERHYWSGLSTFGALLASK